MLAIAELSMASNSSGLCWAVSPSVRAREKLATTPGWRARRALASAREEPPGRRTTRGAGGASPWPRADGRARLARQPGVVASFSRALTEGLTAQQSPEEFGATLDAAIASIYAASST